MLVLAAESTASILGPNRVIAKDVDSCTYCFYVRCTKQAQLLQSIVRTSRQRSCNQRVGCLLCSMAMINELWVGLWISARCVVWSLVLVSGWLLSPSTATPHRFILINTSMFSLDMLTSCPGPRKPYFINQVNGMIISQNIFF